MIVTLGGAFFFFFFFFFFGGGGGYFGYVFLINDESPKQKQILGITMIESRHEISDNVVCATSKASDQSAHTRSLIRAFASRLGVL